MEENKTPEESVNTDSQVNMNEPFSLGDSLAKNFQSLGKGNEPQETVDSSLKEEKVEEKQPEVVSEVTETTPDTKIEEKVTETKSETTTEDGSEPQVQESAEEASERTGLPIKEVLEALNEFSEEEYGLTYQDALEFQSMDFDDPDVIAESDVISLYMEMNEDGITDAEINAHLRKYKDLFLTDAEIQAKIEEDPSFEDRLEDLNADFEKELRTARNFLKEKQALINFDDVSYELQGSTKNNAPQPERDVAKEQQAIKDALNEHYKSFEKDVISIKDKDGNELLTMDYTPDSDGISRAVEAAAGLSSRWLDADGNINVKKWASDMLLLENKEQMFKALYDRATALAKESAVKDINNIEFGKGQTPPPVSSDDELFAAVRQKIGTRF